MAIENKISLTVTDEQREELKHRLNEIVTAYPFFNIPLPPQTNVRTVSSKREPQAERLIELARLFPQYITSEVDINETDTDFRLYSQFRQIHSYYMVHVSKIEQLMYAAGSDVMAVISRIYDLLKGAAKNDPALKEVLQPVIDLLKKKNPAPPTP
jgi:hypothetical protein